MNFADTNWLEAMFLHADEPGSRRAVVEQFHRRNPGVVGLSQIVLLETKNVFLRVTGLAKPPEWDELLAGFTGQFYLDAMNWDFVRRESYRLFEKYSPRATIGSFDAAILASALLAGATRMLSFDENLKALAAAEGLRVFPELSNEGRVFLARLKAPRRQT
jgi:predicted nucleic acid-binding protein